MRHADKRLQLNRFTSWHKATVNSIARALLINQSIKTTKHRAQASRQLIEKLITLAKENTLAAKRRAFKYLQDHKLVALLFSDIGPRFKNRTGGYTRMINLGKRRGDDADIVIFELTEIKKKEIKKHKKSAKSQEAKLEKEAKAQTEEAKPRTELAVKEEKHHEGKKANKKFLSGIRNIFKRERDSL